MHDKNEASAGSAIDTVSFPAYETGLHTEAQAQSSVETTDRSTRINGVTRVKTCSYHARSPAEALSRVLLAPAQGSASCRLLPSLLPQVGVAPQCICATLALAVRRDSGRD
jgi:hypothetical protein